MIEVCSSLQAEVGQQEYADGNWSKGEECIHCFDAGWLVADGIRLLRLEGLRGPGGASPYALAIWEANRGMRVSF